MPAIIAWAHLRSCITRTRLAWLGLERPTAWSITTPSENVALWSSKRRVIVVIVVVSGMACNGLHYTSWHVKTRHGEMRQLIRSWLQFSLNYIYIKIYLSSFDLFAFIYTVHRNKTWIHIYIYNTHLNISKANI